MISMRFLVVLCVALSLPLAFAKILPQPNSTLTSARQALNQCGYFPFFDISPGEDLTSFHTPDISSCCEACQTNTQCRGFSFQVNQNNNCHLKTKTDLVPTTKPTVSGLSPEWTIINIRVYSAINHGGSFTTLQISSFRPCVTSASFIVKSINSMQSCVRIYENPDCTGRTLSLVSPEYADRDFDLIGFPNFKGSFGLCLPHDNCEEADAGICKAAESETREGSTLIVKECDLARHRLTTDHAIHFGVNIIANLVRLNDPRNPIVEYEHDGRNIRTEYLLARIRREHLDTGTLVNDRTRAYCREVLNGYYGRAGICNDDAGHIVGRQLGGTGTETYNLFPQNQNVNRGLWNQLEMMIKQSVQNCRKENGSVQLQVRLLYNGERRWNRPNGFWFRIVFCDGSVIDDVLENYENGRKTYWWADIDLD